MAKISLTPARLLDEHEKQLRQTHWLKVSQYLPEIGDRIMVCNKTQGPFMAEMDEDEHGEPFFNVLTNPDWPERGKLLPMNYWKSLPSRPQDGE